MFKSRLLTSVALAALCLPVAALAPQMPFGSTAAQAQSANVSVQLFFDQLEPHGVWVKHAKYRYVFCPTGVDTAWRPYTQGRWLYLDGRGWYFASDEPFAWATYHYGRWFADRSLGWCWVPGTKWAPAWVSWRQSDNVVGWAPLPPEGDGYSVSIEVSRRDLPEAYWVFVPTERFVEPDLAVSIVIGSQQPEYYTQTQFLGPVTVEGDVVINNNIDVTYIEQTINQQVIVYQPEAVDDPASQSINVEGQAIAIFDTDLTEPTEQEAPPEAVEEADASATIESEGGTAGATAELPTEDPAAAEEQPAADEPAVDVPADSATPADEPAVEEPATEAPVAEDPAAEAPTEEVTPTEPAAPAEEPLCPPETMVDGECPPVEGQAQTEEQPAAEQPAAEQPADMQAAPETAPAEQAPPETAPEAAPEVVAPEATPAPEETAPAPEQAAPAEPEAATPPDAQLPCPPEQVVDGKCPLPAPAEAAPEGAVVQ